MRHVKLEPGLVGSCGSFGGTDLPSRLGVGSLVHPDAELTTCRREHQLEASAWQVTSGAGSPAAFQPPLLCLPASQVQCFSPGTGLGFSAEKDQRHRGRLVLLVGNTGVT